VKDGGGGGGGGICNLHTWRWETVVTGALCQKSHHSILVGVVGIRRRLSAASRTANGQEDDAGHRHNTPATDDQPKLPAQPPEMDGRAGQLQAVVHGEGVVFGWATLVARRIDGLDLEGVVAAVQTLHTCLCLLSIFLGGGGTLGGGGRGGGSDTY